METRIVDHPTNPLWVVIENPTKKQLDKAKSLGWWARIEDGNITLNRRFFEKTTICPEMHGAPQSA